MEKPPKKLKTLSLRERFSWLEEKQGMYFCKFCTINPHLLRTLREHDREEYFVNKGVPKTADPGRKCDVHDKHVSHLQAVDYEKIGREKSVVAMIREKALFDQAAKNKDYDVFIKQYMKVALWLFEREVPHTSNYGSLLDLVAGFNEDICRFGQTRDSNATYRSTTTCTEFMELISDVLDEEATVKLKKSIDTFGSWALMADETSIHGVSFLGIYARYLETDTFDKVTEEMIDCRPIKSTKADSLFEVIDDSLKKRGVNIATLKCVSFDGAAVMSSPVNGLYGRMMVRWELPHLVFQHCRAHRLQLVGRDAAKNSPQAELALGTAHTLYKYFHKSNKKLELLKKISLLQPDYDGYVRRLVEVAPTRWLSYSQAIGRLLQVYDIISLTLDSIQHNVDFDAEDRARASGLLMSMLSRETLTTLFFMDILLGELSTLSCLFQDSQATLETAILKTKSTMSEIARFTVRQNVLEEVESKVNAMVEKLNAAGLELISPLRARRVHSGTDYIERLCTYTKQLLVEINHRFNKDTELLATMLPFDEESWQECIPIVAAQLGFDRGRLCDEGKNVKRHCENYRALSDRKMGKNFWMRFLSDSYTRAMYPEHCSLAAMLLTMPLGSCSVERCFSYTTRIACDSRSALTGDHISSLVRISQKGPTFPTIAEIKIPFEEDNSEDKLDTFLQKVLVKWRMSPRRL